MTVSLGGITLDDNLRIDGVLSQPAMSGSARPTMGGICLQTMSMSGGKALQLVASRDGDIIKGIFSGSQLTSIGTLRDSGAPVTLIHHLGTWSVWIPPDGISVEQVFDYANPGATDWYVGSITLITVS